MKKHKINTEKELQEQLNPQYNRSFEIYNTEFNVMVKINSPFNLKFEDCVFNKGFKITGGIEYTSEIYNCTFNEKFDVSECVFNSTAKFYGSKFKKETSFSNTTFEKLADFWSAQFYLKTIFFKTNFNEVVVFARSKFFDNVLFTYSSIKDIAIFRNTEFVKGYDFSLCIIKGMISWYAISAKDFDSIPDTEDVGKFEHNVSSLGLISHKNKRESYRIIKNNLQSVQNYIDTLDYYGLELNAHKQELKAKNSKWTDLQLHFDKIVICLNEISNFHGRSWTRGVVFTLVTAIIFFYLSIINTKCYYINYSYINFDGFESSFKYFLNL